jgi:hypothetical protein
MKMKNIVKCLSYCLVITATAGLFYACKKQSVEDRGLSDATLDANFTLTSVGGSVNNYIAKVNDSSYIASKWDLGDGKPASIGKSTQEIFLPDAGTYTITHYAIGKGGSIISANKTINVATSDPAKGNLVQGGKFNEGDNSKWTFHTISAGVSFAMNNGKMVASGGSWGHAAIYQAIQVQAGKKYKFSMTVSGSGATDTWFEVYFGTTAPVAGSDYSSGGIQLALNTWTGCGKTPFNGDLATIACAGALVGKKGEITFSQSGTIYLFIKTGGAYLGDSGISIDNVELRGT